MAAVPDSDEPFEEESVVEGCCVCGGSVLYQCRQIACENESCDSLICQKCPAIFETTSKAFFCNQKCLPELIVRCDACADFCFASKIVSKVGVQGVYCPPCQCIGGECIKCKFFFYISEASSNPSFMCWPCQQTE